MEMLNKSTLNQDPDYVIPFGSASSRENVFEIEARTRTANKISKIIDAEFLNEINSKKSEIYSIYRNLNKACKMLHYLRFAIITDFYNQENNYDNEVNTLKQLRLHPTVNSPTKRPAISSENNCFKKFVEEKRAKRKVCQGLSETKKICSQNVCSENKEESLLEYGFKYKMKKRIIVGNISKWIPPEFRSDTATHKWTVYIRDSEKCDISKFVSKVRFFLHPSYKPNDVIELSSTPFHLSRHGWGEFPIRVQLHFVNNIDKPIDIIHNLKLDRTFTGLQTIGSETLIDIWISSKYIKETSNNLNVQSVSEEESKNIYNKSKKISKQQLQAKLSLELDHDYTCSMNINSCETSNHTTETKIGNDLLANNSQKSGILLEKLSTSNHTEIKMNVDDSIESTCDNYAPQKNVLSILLPKNTKDLKKYNLSSNVTHCTNVKLNNKDKIENDDNIYNSSHYYFEIDDKKCYSRSDNHVNSLRNSLIHLIRYMMPKSLFNTLKFIAHRMPLITEKSVDPNYKILHPYATESFQLFNNYSKGKQQAIERCRAVSVLNILKRTKNFSNDCNTKEFIIWARRYCYSPSLNIKDIYSNLCNLNECQASSKYKLSSTISDKVNKWLIQCHATDPNVHSFKKETEEIIDILNISKFTADTLSSCNLRKTKNKVILMEYPDSQTSLNDFVCKSVQKIGIKFANEEIISGVSHNTASTLMTKALLCLVDEMVRLAFSCALDRCKNQADSITITTEDIRMALLKREEFEIFTNAGLGSEG